MIEAITFDFWDTIAVDDSDEPKRRARGLPTKAEARAALFADAVMARYGHICREEAVAAYGRAHEEFRRNWHEEYRTPGIAARLYVAYECLGLKPPPGEYARMVREVDEIVREIETMEIRIQPDFAPGVHNTLQLLAQEYKLGIVSDTIHTHGRGLRYLLQWQGLLQYFSFFVFSDEVGAAKPDTRVFYQATTGLGYPPHMVAHVGDRESNDVAGPLAIGMRAILYTGIVDRREGRTRANAVCQNMRDLPAIVRRLR
jgi:HAD superfamily hydrolase (TIGR01549 family)